MDTEGGEFEMPVGARRLGSERQASGASGSSAAIGASTFADVLPASMSKESECARRPSTGA
jgi:hypothetical protein